MEPKDILVGCVIFLIFAIALLVPHVHRTYTHKHYDDIDDIIDEALGEEGHVTY